MIDKIKNTLFEFKASEKYKYLQFEMLIKMLNIDRFLLKIN